MMEERDGDDLLPNTEDDWSENDEQVLEDQDCFILNTEDGKLIDEKFRLIGYGFLLVLTSTCLVITLPLYSNAMNIESDAYTLMFFTCTITICALLILTKLSHKFGTISTTESDLSLLNIQHPSIWRCPIELAYVIELSVILGLGTMLIMYALADKRVMCHLQDPIKGILLVFSLMYYFFFCRKFMGLQRIFSCTTIIVGLFISVDYGLCDEFRCRGYERETRAEDAGDWTSKTHIIWSGVYILGLAFYAAYFTIMERCLVPRYTQVTMYRDSEPNTFLSTISRLVSSSQHESTTNLTESPRSNASIEKIKTKSIFCLALWIHAFILIILICLFWTDCLTHFGQTQSFAEFWNIFTNGIKCHFQFSHDVETPVKGSCGYIPTYGWPFIFNYIVYSITTIKFLSISQSAVFTVALVTVALPISGLWWSMFQINQVHNGILMWAPSISGELICSLLGLPIVLLGVGLLYKSHFKELNEIEKDKQGGIDHEYSSASTGMA